MNVQWWRILLLKGIAGVLLVSPLALPLPAAESAPTKETAPQIDPKVEQLVQQVGKLLQQADRLSVNLTMAFHTEMPGMKQEIAMEYSLAWDRPNKLALSLKSGLIGGTIVSDGTKLYTYSPIRKRYTETAAPKDLSEMFSRDAGIVDMAIGPPGFPFLKALVAHDPAEAMLARVHSAKYVGEALLGKVQCHHAKFSQREMDWELWVETGPQPFVRQVNFDMSKARNSATSETEALGQKAEMLKTTKTTMTLTFSNWEINPSFSADRFIFTPPEGAKKSDSLIGGLDETESTRALVGQPAPTFEVELLDGGHFDLAAHRGKHVVILDFWATRRSLSVRTLLTLAEMAAAYRDRGVVFCPINQQEDANTIRNFLKKKDLKLNVALDSKGKVSELYEVKRIPQTVIIDTNGVVQAVHVGLLRNSKTRLQEELDAVLAGKNLAAADATATYSFELKNLTAAWTIVGRWVGVACDPGQATGYAVAIGGTAIEFNPDGHTQREFYLTGPAWVFQGEFRLTGSAWVLRTANLAGDAARELVSFQCWGHAVFASDRKGNTLWKYAEDRGVGDVCAADLDGDGLDEVIIGYNGHGGLHGLDNQGRLLWKNTDIGNVSYVSAGDVDGDGAIEVVSTSAKGRVHIFNVDGKKVRDLKPSGYANLVCLAENAQGGRKKQIIVGCSVQKDNFLAGLSAEGKEQWRQPLASGDKSHVNSVQAAPNRPWLAVLLRDGQVRVIQTATGEVLAQIDGLKNSRGQVAWFARASQEAPLLLVATGRDLRAFQIESK